MEGNAQHVAFIDNKGHIITNFHVIQGSNEILVRDSNGNDHQTSVIGYDFLTDLAVIKIDDNSLKNTQLGDKIVDALEKKLKLSVIRQMLADSGAREFDGLFKVLYDNVSKYTDREGEAILIIAKYQYEYTFVLEKEICIAAMLNKLLDIC